MNEELRRQHFFDHLDELKKRVIYSLIAFVIAATVCFFFAQEILDFLMAPLKSAALRSDFRMIFTSLPEVFMTHITLALASGFIFSFPFIASQLWIFMAPALYKHERQSLLPYFVGAPILFTLGAALCYYAAMPAAWQFFMSYETPGGDIPVLAETRIADYVSLSLQFIIAFGLTFQTPLVLLLLARIGVVNAGMLAGFRRYAIVIILIIAAIITPTPDIFGQILIAVPLWLLYEISIILIRTQKNHARSEIHPPAP